MKHLKKFYESHIDDIKDKDHLIIGDIFNIAKDNSDLDVTINKETGKKYNFNYCVQQINDDEDFPIDICLDINNRLINEHIEFTTTIVYWYGDGIMGSVSVDVDSLNMVHHFDKIKTGISNGEKSKVSTINWIKKNSYFR